MAEDMLYIDVGDLRSGFPGFHGWAPVMSKEKLLALKLSGMDHTDWCEYFVCDREIFCWNDGGFEEVSGCIYDDDFGEFVV